MRALVWLILLGALAVGLALAAQYNDGYVLIVLPPWRVELSLNLLIVGLIVLFVLLHLLLRTISLTLGLPDRVRAHRLRRRQEKAATALNEAVLLWLGGRYARSITQAELAWQTGHAPEVASLVALGAAHALRDEKKVDEWQKRAMLHDEGNHHARLLLEAQLAVDARRFTEALALLGQIGQESGRHIVAMRLALRAHRGLNQWAEILPLARQLQKHHALTALQAAPLITTAHRERIKALAADGHSLASYWAQIPAAEQGAAGLALDTARAMLASGEAAAAQALIEAALEDEWDSKLVAVYGECNGPDPLGRLARAEEWLAAHPRDAGLLLTLGRLCLQKQLWGKAQSYFEASLSLQASHTAHLELARLFERLGQTEIAQRHYRAAAEIST